MSAAENIYYTYLTHINKIPLLSREEEYKLAKRASNGDLKAKQKLVAANLKFVVQTAKYYANSDLSIEDLISEGNLGLIRAVDSFEPEKGYHFISYAVYWIKQAIIKAISEKSRIVRLPLNVNNSITSVKKKINTEYNGENSVKNINAVSKDMNLDYKKVVNILKYAEKHSSLNKTIKVNNKNVELEHVIKDDSNKDPESMIYETSLKNEIQHILRQELTAQETEIIILRYGLVDQQPLTLSEIGTLLKLTKERIRQIEKNALRKLKNRKIKEKLNPYMK